jgi:hypothetical protein
MNIKNALLICIGITFGSAVHAQYDYADHRIIHYDFVFKKGSKEVLYGDKVIFRAEPSVNARALDTLSIGTQITIVEETNETMMLNGLQSTWYKVKRGRKTGYILGGLIALDHAEIQGDSYLVTYAGGEEDYMRKARCRVLKPNGDFYGHEVDLGTSTFYIEAFDNKGVKGVENMLTVNLLAEACGVDGGSTYLFNDGERLIEAIHAASVGDGGFWFNEALIFPNEEEGIEGYIQYEREIGEPMNDDYSWSRSVVNNVLLKWENGALAPNVKELDFGD